MEITNSDNLQNTNIEDEIDLKSIFKFFKRGKSFIFGIVLTSTLLSTLFAFTTKPRWSGSFNIVVKKDATNSNSSNTFGSYSLFLKSIKKNNENETQRLILMSPSVLMPVFDFVKSYYDARNINTEKLFFKEWVKYNLNINFKNDTSVLKVEFINEDKELIKKTLELISTKYKDYSKRDTEKQLNKTIKYLIKQIDIMKDKSLISTKKFNEFSINNGLGSIDGFVGLGDTTSLGGNSKMFNLVNSNNEITGLNKKRNLSKNNPAIRFQNQFRMLETYEANFIDLSSKLKPNSSTLKELKRRIENLRSALKRPNEILLEYRRLNVEAARNDNILQELESSLQVLQLNKIKSPDPWELISVPTIDNKPVYPLKKRIILVGFLTSFLLASLIFLIKEKCSGKIYDINNYKKYIDFKFLDFIYKNNQKININIIGNLMDINARTAVIRLSDEFIQGSTESQINEINNLKNFEFISFNNLENLSKFKNIFLIVEEGNISKENINLINKYLIPYKKEILGWFYLV